MWLAESSEAWSEAISPQAVFTSYDKLLDAGFDGYYGSFFNIKDWKNAKDLQKDVSTTLSNVKSFKDKKSVIGSFTTHDEVSPILLKGSALSDMIIWLSATLPVNSYFVDGFQTGDDYLYKAGNRLSDTTLTDDDIYFTHRGKIDIFNLSRKPEGQNLELKNEFLLGNNVKKSLLPVLNSSNINYLKTSDNKVFAYMFSNGVKKIITIGNLDFENSVNATVKVPKLKPKRQNVLPIKISNMPEIKNGKITLKLKAGEIVVLVVHELL
jgi:hypothetical protein